MKLLDVFRNRGLLSECKHIYFKESAIQHGIYPAFAYKKLLEPVVII